MSTRSDPPHKMKTMNQNMLMVCS